MSIPFILGGLQMGAGMLEGYAQNQQAKEAVRFENKQTRLRNKAAMQEWQYNEQMRQIEQRQREALYEMAKQEFTLQKELNYDEYEDFFEDAQIDFNNQVRDAVNQNFATDAKLAKAQGMAVLSNSSRGVGGRRSSRASQAMGLEAGMQKTNVNEKLLFAEEMMGLDVKRAARDTDLRNRLAFNRIGPAPEQLPVAPMPIPGAMRSGPGNMGMFTSFLSSAMEGLNTWDSLSPTGAFNQRAIRKKSNTPKPGGGDGS